VVAGGNDDNILARLVETNTKSNETTTKLLERMDSSDRTVAMSGATQSKKEDVLKHFDIAMSGAKWSSKPEDAALSDITNAVYTWTSAGEDELAQREAYMEHLKDVLFLPAGYAVKDCAKKSTLLSVQRVGGKFKFDGKTDVVVAKTEHVDSSAERNHVEVALELKTTRNNNMEEHEPQAVLEHLSSSFLNRACGVLTVLTDLNEEWVFYWFHPNGKEIMKYKVDRKRAQILLNNMIPDKSNNACTSANLPEHFWNRGNWNVVQKAFVDTIEEEDDDDEGGKGNKRRKQERGSRKESSNARDGKSDSNQGGDSASSGMTHGGSGHDEQQNCTLAKLFDYVGHDVGNEMDLLGMTDDEDERIRIVRRFLARHIVPGIVGAGISDVGIDCRTPPSDEIACPTLSESNVLRHNTAS
jgi:hypothetical protein